MPVAMASRTSRSVFNIFFRCYSNRRNPDRTLQLRNLSWRTGDDEITQYFEKFGKIDKVFTRQNDYRGIGRGFGMVVFRKQESLNAVLDQREHIIDGRQIFIKSPDTFESKSEITSEEPSL
ncbi:hypothetical protein ACF0H5_003571 [Mactra antiquata]